MHNPHYTVLGAYALVARLQPHLIPEAYQRIARLNIDALEIPLAEFNSGVELIRSSATQANTAAASKTPGALSFGPLDTGLDVVVTCIPTVMQSLGANPHYGLASSDDEGRAHAIADVVQVLENADRLAQVEQRQRLRAIQIHSAPRRHNSDPHALEESLSHILNRAGTVNLAIEHCDALRADFDYEKGFLELDQELAVIGRINSDQLGVTINWGRSAIEARSSVSTAPTDASHRSALTSYVTDSVALAAASGHLKGLMFSGAADTAGPWGPAFEDSHIAPCGDHPALAQSHGSLMGAPEIQAALLAAGPAETRWYTGAKVTVLDAETDVDRCIAVAEATLGMLAEQPTTHEA